MNKYLVTVHHLNLRKDPSLIGKLCGALDKNDIVECFKISGDSHWFKIRSQKGLEGWATHKHLLCLDNDEDIQDNESYSWMPIAIRELGKREYTGFQDNPRILMYMNSTTLGHSEYSKDNIKWGSSFVNWCVEASGCDGTDSAWAISWKNWGKAIETPHRGCIVILDKGDNTGHAGFFVEEIDGKIGILGANQTNAVCYQYFEKTAVGDKISYRAPLHS